VSKLPQMDRTRVEVSTRDRQGTDRVVHGVSPAERMAMVWQLTLDAWAFKDPKIAESRFQRHAIRVIRGQS
jgi:hypothetical protein